MLRRLLVISITVLYTASAVGMPLHFHYCRGELKHVTVFVKMSCHDGEQEGDAHGCCQNKAPQCHTGLSMQQCCDDATQWIQEKLPAVLAKVSEFALCPAIHTVAGSTVLEPSPSEQADFIAYNTNTPHGPPIYLRDCSLIYYG